MKKMVAKQILFFSLLIIITFIACKKSDSSIDSNSTQTLLSGKWKLNYNEITDHSGGIVTYGIQPGLPTDYVNFMSGGLAIECFNGNKPDTFSYSITNNKYIVFPAITAEIKILTKDSLILYRNYLNYNGSSYEVLGHHYK